MQRLTVNAHERTEMKKLRKLVLGGFVPGVVYDQTGASKMIKIPANEVERLLQHIKGTPLVDIDVEGKDKHVALLKEVQVDKRINQVNHLSFLALDPNKKALFEVDIELSGESPAAKNNLGVLLFTRNSLELRGLPKDIPSKLIADITSLENVGDTIFVSDLDIPDTLEFVNEKAREYSVATIQAFQKVEEEAPAAEEVAEGEEATAQTGEEQTAEGAEQEAGEATDGSQE